MQDTYLVTGASRGMGRALVLELAREATVKVIGLARDRSALKELARECEREGCAGEFVGLPFDLTKANYEDLYRLLQPHLPLSGLVNNAGFLLSETFDAMDEKKWKEIFDINVFAPVKLCRLLKNDFRPPAHVVNIGSMGGYQGSSKYPGLAAYSSSKSALATFSECLAGEWAEKGVAVNCLAMGAVQTEMLATAFPGYEAPLSAEEAAGFLSWFLRNGGRFFNGKVLPVALQNP